MLSKCFQFSPYVNQNDDMIEGLNWKHLQT